MHKSFHHIFRLRKSFFAMLKETMFNLKNVEKIVAKILIVYRFERYLRSFIALSQKLEVNPYESKLSFASEAD